MLLNLQIFSYSSLIHPSLSEIKRYDLRCLILLILAPLRLFFLLCLACGLLLIDLLTSGLFYYLSLLSLSHSFLNSVFLNLLSFLFLWHPTFLNNRMRPFLSLGFLLIAQLLIDQVIEAEVPRSDLHDLFIVLVEFNFH